MITSHPALSTSAATATRSPFARWTTEEVEPLDSHSHAWLTNRLGALTATPEINPADIGLEPSRLGDRLRRRLDEIVGSDFVRTDRLARLAASAGSSYTDLLRQREGYDLHPPDAVASPASEAEVISLLMLAEEWSFTVVPRGGGTSVVQGVEPMEAGAHPRVVLDLSRLSGVRQINLTDRTASFAAGTTGPQAEAALAERGLSLGHVPQSFQRASLGGYAATRSSGQTSTGYGSFADILVGLRVATSRGVISLGTGTPNAAGPDLRQLFVGSEGALGVITEVTLRVRPAPEVTRYEGWVFPSFDSGLTALRTLAQDGVRADSIPDVCRLSDAEHTAVQLGLMGGATQAVVTRYLRLRGIGSGCLAIVGWEGTKPTVAARRGEARRVLQAHGAVRLGGRVGDAWHSHRFQAPHQRDSLLAAGVLVETLETATTWSRLTELREDVRRAVLSALSEPGTDPIVMAHVSHCYPTGASIYFTALARRAGRRGDTAAAVLQWDAAKRAASEAIVDSGATITHHHAVGRAHMPWLGAEVGPVALEIVAAAKRVVDPSGTLNPGVLVPAAGSPRTRGAVAGGGTPENLPAS